MIRMTSALVLFSLLCVPAAVDGQNNARKKSQVQQGTAAEYVQLKKQSDVYGKLAKVDPVSSANRTFRLDIPYQYPITTKGKNRLNPRGTGTGGVHVPNTANLQSQMASLVREQEQIQRIKNPVQREQKLAQLMMKMQSLQARMQLAQAHLEFQLERAMTRQAVRIFNQAKYGPNTTLATAFKEFQMEAIDGIVVRRQNPPVEYDDKGNVKKFTKEELEQLKGKDKTLPGYTAAYEDLKAGQMLKVYVAKPKSDKKDDKAENKANAADDKVEVAKKDDAALPGSDLPQVRMILILADAPDLSQDPMPQKNKKNQ
jgi:hypothetical protein